MSLDLQFYRRLLDERLGTVRSAVDQLWSVMGESDQARKTESAHAVRAALDALMNTLSQQDRPQWGTDLQRVIGRYSERSGNQGEANRLLRALARIEPELRTQAWTHADTATAIDFEDVFARYSRESRLDALFDKLIAGLEEIVGSGSVDSVRIQRALETVLATLRKNARASLAARKGALEVTSAFLENLGWEALSDIPVIGAVARAVRKTLDDTTDEVRRVEDGARTEIVRVAQTHLPKRLSAGGDERLLPPPAGSNEPTDVEATVEDA